MFFTIVFYSDIYWQPHGHTHGHALCRPDLSAPNQARSAVSVRFELYKSGCLFKWQLDPNGASEKSNVERLSWC